MSETRWTAPWSVEVEPDNREWVLDANGHIVCSLTMERGVSLPRAHLIAAAPDLAEACRIALLHAPSIRLAPERRKTIEVLEAALAKAKGEG